MRPATLPPEVRTAVRLLAVDPARGERRDLVFSDLADLLEPPGFPFIPGEHQRTAFQQR